MDVQKKIFSPLTVIAGVVLVFGLGIFVVTLQKPQDTRTHASSFPNPGECGSDGCCSDPNRGGWTGAMCKYDYEGACPGGMLSTAHPWLCPLGDNYRCCKDAAPSANAGNDQTTTLPDDSVTLSGGCSDADTDSRNLDNCTWTKASGPAGGSIQNPASGLTEVTGLQQGTYTFKLTAWDGFVGAEDTAIVTVNAAPVANKPPVANAGQDQTITLPDNDVTLTGSATDEDGAIASYYWTKKSGPDGVDIKSTLTQSTQVLFAVEGTYVFTLTVTDNKGATDTDDVSVTVTKLLPTKLNFDIMFHGIGKIGDNSSENEMAGTGNPDPLNKKRNVDVKIYDPNIEAPVVSKVGEANYDATLGGYKVRDLDLGTTLTQRTYEIEIKFSQSLPRKITRDVVPGTTMTLPLFKLVNGDTNNDRQLDIDIDYKNIADCYSDFGSLPIDCNSAKKALADIDDDGDVNQYDLVLFLREMRVQRL